MTDFRFDNIKQILIGNNQPWHIDNDLDYGHYTELLRNTPQMAMPEMAYSIKCDNHLLFTSRIRYYCRLVDNETAQQLRRVKRLLDSDGSEQLARYVLKIVRENIVTLIKDAVRQCRIFIVDAHSLKERDANFAENKEQKEFLVILHYTIASLVCCWMQIQEMYGYFLDETELYDIKTFYVHTTGMLEPPLVNVEEEKMDEGSMKKQVTYCSFLYNNNDQDEWNISIQAFYNKLIEYGQIPPDTDKAQFMNVFRGRSTRAIITWIGKSNSPLHAIISRGIKDKWLTVYPSTCSHWHVVSCRFVDKEGNPIPNLGKTKDNKGDIEMVKDIISTIKV